MYDSNHFEKSEMLDWEKKPTIIKTKYVNAKLTDIVAKLVLKENKNPNVGGGGEKKGDRDRRPQATKLRNMGAYCHSHGFHPVGAGHNSMTCSYKKAEHNTEATWEHRLEGDMYWPTAKRVAIE
jgi:hypothetical protein